MVEVTAQGDFGPHTQVRLTEWIENVPVKDPEGRVIGRAKVSDTGMIHAVIDDSLLSKDLFDGLRTRMSSGVSFGPFTQPAVQVFDPPIASEHPNLKYSDEVRRRFDEANAPHIKEQPDA